MKIPFSAVMRSLSIRLRIAAVTTLTVCRWYFLIKALLVIDFAFEFYQLLGFAYSVTEIFCSCIAFCYERIIHITLILSAKIMYLSKLSKLG